MSAVDVPALVARLTARSETVGCAESLTGGLLTATLVQVPGVSAVLRGGVVAYATPLKAAVLGVPERLLAERGAVDPDVAAAMAEGAARVLGADWGVATTGVAGPDPQDGAAVGTAYIAVSRVGREPVVQRLQLPGDRPQIRQGCVERALRLLDDGLA